MTWWLLWDTGLQEVNSWGFFCQCPGFIGSPFEGKGNKRRTTLTEKCGQPGVVAWGRLLPSPLSPPQSCAHGTFIILYILCRMAQNNGSSLRNHNLGSKPLKKPSPIHQRPRGNAAFLALYQMESWLFSCFCGPQWSLCMLAGSLQALTPKLVHQIWKANQTVRRERNK